MQTEFIVASSKSDVFRGAFYRFLRRHEPSFEGA